MRNVRKWSVNNFNSKDEIPDLFCIDRILHVRKGLRFPPKHGREPIVKSKIFI